MPYHDRHLRPSKGLCRDCPKPVKPGTTRCESCGEKLRAYLQSEHYMHPLCPVCRRRVVKKFPDHDICSVCRRKKDVKDALATGIAFKY